MNKTKRLNSNWTSLSKTKKSIWNKSFLKKQEFQKVNKTKQMFESI